MINKNLYVPVCISDGNMDDQELNEPQNRVALLKGNCGSSSVLCSSALCCTNIIWGQVNKRLTGDTFKCFLGGAV